jgi:hypothetical protein
MVTGRLIISDLTLILNNFKLNQNGISERTLLQLIARKREKQIVEYYNRSPEIDPTWLQTLSKVFMTKEDLGCFVTGFAIIPTPISLPGDRGLVNVISSNGELFYHHAYDKMLTMNPDVEQFKFNKARTRLGNKLSIWPYELSPTVIAILSDPMHGYFIDASIVLKNNLFTGDDYMPASEYEVINNTIEHDGTLYQVGQTFTATVNTYTGIGDVRLKNSIKKMTLDDPYPMSLSMANTVIMRILDEDYGVARKQISDIIADGQSQTNILTSEALQK